MKEISYERLFSVDVSVVWVVYGTLALVLSQCRSALTIWFLQQLFVKAVVQLFQGLACWNAWSLSPWGACGSISGGSGGPRVSQSSGSWSVHKGTWQFWYWQAWVYSAVVVASSGWAYLQAVKQWMLTPGVMVVDHGCASLWASGMAYLSPRQADTWTGLWVPAWHMWALVGLVLVLPKSAHGCWEWVLSEPIRGPLGGTYRGWGGSVA